MLTEFRKRRLVQRKNLAVRKLQVVFELQRLEQTFNYLALGAKTHHEVLAAMRFLETESKRYLEKFNLPVGRF